MKSIENKCPFIILLSGTPGTGKTSIARALSQQIGWTIFSMGDFIKNNKLYTAEKDHRDALIIDTEIAARESAKEILQYSMNSEVIIIDSHYADILMDGFDDLTSEINNKCLKDYIQGNHVFGIVCRCHPSILQERLRQRNYSELKISENLQAEILSESTQNMIEVLEKEKIFEINTTNYSITEIIHEIEKFYIQSTDFLNFEGKILQIIGKIDWIVTLNEEGTLNSYFQQDFGESVEIKLEKLKEKDTSGDPKNEV